MTARQRTALVTGGGRGIGRAIAIALGAQGAAVGVNFLRDAASAAETVRLVGESGGRAVAIQADVTDTAEASRAVAHVEQTFGPLDICVVNAGLARDGLLGTQSAEDFDAVIRGNLRGAWATLRAVLPGMRERRGGCVLAISSVSSRVANPGQTAYAAAKAGVEAMVRTAAREVAPWVRVNALVVGLIATEMTEQMTARQKERALSRIPLDRMGTVEEVAAAAAYLCDDTRSGYVTGTCLAVDGGLTA
ncbi:MAG: SDR family oxidoreductase [Planctomycetota bacterium]|jgi:3-oxoacyl-[acyl-carrier protein] reductase